MSDHIPVEPPRLEPQPHPDDDHTGETDESPSEEFQHYGTGLDEDDTSEIPPKSSSGNAAA